MNIIDTSRLLAVIAAVDRRTVGETDIAAWQDLLADIDLGDAIEAVRAHRKSSTEWITPAHVITGVKTLRARRHETANLIYEPDPAETVNDFLTRARGANRAAAAGNVIPIRPGIALPPGQAAPAPPSIGQLVSEVRATRTSPALKVPCPWEACLAPAGQWCEKPYGRGRRAVAGFLHPKRCEAAGVTFQPRVPETTDEERRSREIARELTAHETAGGER